MRVQQPVRDRNTSIWQSAVRQTLVDRNDLSDDDKKLAEYGVSLHAKSSENGTALPDPIPVPDGAAKPIVSSPVNIALASKAVFDSLQAHQNTPTEASGLFTALSGFVMRYSSWDIGGWAQCGWYYTKYYVLAHLPPSYNDWQAHAPADINFGVIDYRLPKNSRVLMIGDWGTHMPDNVALLRQALKKFNPDVIIHLGDVYYSGTVEECTANVLDVLDQVVADLKLAKRPAFFSIPGNHDYYSGGSGFYRMIGKVNSGVAGCTQQASYFCLRTEDSQWQFLGMDTARASRRCMPTAGRRSPGKGSRRNAARDARPRSSTWMSGPVGGAVEPMETSIRQDIGAGRTEPGQRIARHSQQVGAPGSLRQ